MLATNFIIAITASHLASIADSTIPFSTSICPRGCICSRTFNSVSCQGALLADMPRGIEQSTTSLDFSKNSLTYINTQTFMFLKKLVQLKLDHNEIESIADGSFGKTSSLQSIDLSSNSLSELRNYTFLGTDMLLRLDVSDNRLTVIDGAFAHMRELSRLNLCKNRLGSITENTFQGLVNLRYLLLCDNSIRFIDKNSFSTMDKLMYIVLRNNQLKDLREFHFTSTFLSYVDLSECCLDCLPKGLPNSIRYLQLRRNNLTYLDRFTFQDCRFISILVLDYNKIERIDEDTFDGMIYLQQLWLNGNRLRIISSRLPAGLQRLFLDSNFLEDIPGDVFPLDSGLETLSLASNELESLPVNGFRNFRSLRKLDLSGNRISRLSNESFFHVNKLNDLDLSRNPLKFFRKHCFRSLTQLQKLYLAYIATVLPQIDPDAFQGLENVARLDLESSSGLILKLTTSDDLLSCFSGVRELNLRKSQLTGLRYDFFEFFPNLSHLQLTSNRWCCDKTLQWLKNWFKSLPANINASRLEENFCYSPFELRGQSIWKINFVDYTDFTCHVFVRDSFEDDDDDSDDHYPTFGQADTTKNYLSEFKPKTIDSVIYDWEEDLESSSFFSTPSTKPVTSDYDLPVISNKPTRQSGLTVSRSTRVVQRVQTTRKRFVHFPFATLDRSKPDFHLARPPSTPPNVQLLSDYQIDETSPSSETFFMLAVVLISIIVFIGMLLLVFIVCLVSKSLKVRKLDSQKHHQHPVAEKPAKTNGLDFKYPINSSTDFSPSNSHLLAVQDFMPLKNSKDYASDADGRMIKDCYSSPSSTSHRQPKNNALTLAKTREFMTLIPGRDVNHEGPLRVYKWADF